MDKRKNRAFDRFVELVGGKKIAARVLGISPYTVGAYRRGERQVSRPVARDAEKLTEGRITRIQLLYPDEYE